MERQACEIRLRAERRAGQLLAEMEKAKGARERGTERGTTRSHDVTASAGQTLDDLGVSKRQSSDWQKLAKLPDEEFEEAVRAERPSTSGIIAAGAPRSEPKKNAVSAPALWFWGRLLDIERDNLLDLDPNDLVVEMLPHMQATTRDIAICQSRKPTIARASLTSSVRSRPATSTSSRRSASIA